MEKVARCEKDQSNPRYIAKNMIYSSGSEASRISVVALVILARIISILRYELALRRSF